MSPSQPETKVVVELICQPAGNATIHLTRSQFARSKSFKNRRWCRARPAKGQAVWKLSAAIKQTNRPSTTRGNGHLGSERWFESLAVPVREEQITHQSSKMSSRRTYIYLCLQSFLWFFLAVSESHRLPWRRPILGTVILLSYIIGSSLTNHKVAM